MSQNASGGNILMRSLYAVVMLVVTITAGAGGCQRSTILIPTPTVNLYAEGKKAFDSVPAVRRTPSMEILFASDRPITKSAEETTEFGTGRSGVLTIGVAKVGFVPDLTWDELVQISTSGEERPRGPYMKLESIRDLGVLAVPLAQMEVRDGRYMLTHAAANQIAAGRATLHKLITDRLADSPRKDVYIFVHGFNNTFEDATFRLAMAWHMAGRPGVPIVYAWPAGHGGLTGYAVDRESGEFTVSHLRRFLKDVAACEEVERIHLIAHSRGTDVAISAVRELNIETRAKNLRTKEVYKLDDIVLAAPDLDAEVFEQRFAIEDLHLAANRVTVYLSKTDFALAVSRWMFGGSRVGDLRPEDFTPDARAKLAQLKGFYLIDCNVTGHSGSHDYAFIHPAVVSDLILLLRDGKEPGAANGRPMTQQFEGVWEINNDYLMP